MRRHQRVSRPFRCARSHFGCCSCSHRGCVTVGASRGESGEAASDCSCSWTSSSSSESDESSSGEGSARAEMRAAGLDFEEDMAAVERVRLSRGGIERDETKVPVVLRLQGMQCCGSGR